MAQDDSYAQDPILRFRPSFAQSLPVQLLLTGIVLTLAAVLLLHLVFTAQYHWPLARTNYVLQLTGVTTLLISLTATIYVVFSATVQQSQHWPYMLSYLAVEMPPAYYPSNSTDPTLLYQQRWSVAESATWVVMNATTSAIVQVTHIHFLTLLFPSDLEARLIFGLLGPLAIISAVMQLLPVICGASVTSIAEDTRNVCNAALSLLFTSFLIIWGFFVNRRQAWRTDGGTAAFGAGAIILAVISTSLNFVYIPKQDQYTWMPKLMWSVTLWQSFLGWWWWVGAGMGVREVEDLLSQENKRQQKRLLRAKRRREQREKAKSVWRGVTGAFKPSARADQLVHTASGGRSKERSEDVSRSPSRAPTAASTVTTLGSSAFMQPVQLVQRWYARLRHAHLTAAHIQATERAERFHQVYHREEVRNLDRDHRKQVVGWGLGSYSLREAERERREEMEMETEDEMEMEARIPQVDVDEEEWKDIAPSHESAPDRLLRHRGASQTPGPPLVAQQAEEPAGSSLWWWGPLRRWRLQDSTTYR